MFDPCELIKNIQDRNLGDTCFIIGGGSSLLKTLPDASVLDNKPVITTNNAYKLFKNPLICHFSDSTWYYWWKKEIAEEIKNGKIFTTAAHVVTPGDLTYLRAGVYQFGAENRIGGISTIPGKVNGNNAGHQAINLATHMLFKNIILLGFDMNPQARQTHWHNEHKRDTNRTQYKSTMIPGMDKVSKQQEALGFKVYNANRESHLKCFEFTDLEKWL